MMLDVPTEGSLPSELASEIDRAKERMADLPPAQRQACALFVAARLLTWAQDLERLSTQFSRAA